MILLPQESVERLQATLGNDKIKSVQTPDSVTSRLDAEMNEILNSPTCKDDREKWTLYRQVLQRYLHFKGNEGGEKYKNDSVVDLEEETDQRIDAGIIYTIPKRYKEKAKQLMQRLRACGKVVWDANDAVTIDGTLVPGANIVDLVNDAMRDRRRSAPPGHLQFAVALRQSTVPREFIGNKRVWNEVATISSTSDHSENGVFTTPSRVPVVRVQSSGDSTADETESSKSEKRRKKSAEKKKKVSPPHSEILSWRGMSKTLGLR